MRIFLPLIAASAFVASAAFAQPMPEQSSPQNPAVKSMDQNNASAPVEGANSFTKGEAQSRIEARGYTHVRSLMKDSSGVWRGKARKDGQTVAVSVDYQGNVN